MLYYWYIYRFICIYICIYIYICFFHNPWPAVQVPPDAEPIPIRRRGLERDQAASPPPWPCPCLSSRRRPRGKTPKSEENCKTLQGGRGVLCEASTAVVMLLVGAQEAQLDWSALQLKRQVMGLLAPVVAIMATLGVGKLIITRRLLRAGARVFLKQGSRCALSEIQKQINKTTNNKNTQRNMHDGIVGSGNRRVVRHGVVRHAALRVLAHDVHVALRAYGA